MTESFLGGRVALHCGDCRDVLAGLGENSLDACVTDPPYGLEFMGVGWDTFSDRPKGKSRPRNEWGDFGSREHARNASEQAGIARNKNVAFEQFSLQWAQQIYRVLKPGAHLVACGGTRTYHRMACAIEDAGFEIRDTIAWLYGSGFPKSHDVSKGIDRAAGAEREVVGLKSDPRYLSPRRNSPNHMDRERGVDGGHGPDHDVAIVTAPATDAARQWDGWGTALKPACELIVLARKPLSESTVAANVLRWGTGAINVDGCRVALNGDEDTRRKPVPSAGWCIASPTSGSMDNSALNGRWPANLIHDGSDEVIAAFPDARSAGIYGNERNISEGMFGTRTGGATFDDSGSAARFFYTAKADSDDRLGSKHPTVKPLDLMAYLVRLITPKGGTVIDPFSGTGTTGEAAWREGMRAVLIEREEEYQADIRRRMALVLAGPDERARESIKAKAMPVDHGPLFSWAADHSWDEMWTKPFDFSKEPAR